ncbi:MAG TPA: universal stress protein [Acidimicrobiia bacterium]|nr:universal stress protein [Acidimicrobiia bacterium]
MPVVVGVDDSPVAPEIVARALEQARWRDAELHVAHVKQLPMTYSDAPVDWRAVAEAQRSAVWAGLDEVLSETDIPVKRVDVEGYPPDTLVRYASDINASLLVVGTRGRGEFASLILGSTSHRAIHLAECDVLIVKPTESEA